MAPSSRNTYTARRGPSEVRLNQAMRGWTEGLQLVGEGGMIELEIPPELGYGVRGMKPRIPAECDAALTVRAENRPLIETERARTVTSKTWARRLFEPLQLFVSQRNNFVGTQADLVKAVAQRRAVFEAATNEAGADLVRKSNDQRIADHRGRYARATARRRKYLCRRRGRMIDVVYAVAVGRDET